jgi:Domain of unknown function (DUF4911)
MRVDAAMGETPQLKSVLITIRPHWIALLKAIIESYDNLATLRTEDPRRNRLRLYFAADQAAEVEGLLASLKDRFAIERLD